MTLSIAELCLLVFIPFRSILAPYELYEEALLKGRKKVRLLGKACARITLGYVTTFLYAIFAACLVSAATTRTSAITSVNGSSDCSEYLQLDPDIAGLGTRWAAWIQIGALSIVYFLGLAIREPIGAKELGGGLLLTHVALAISIVFQLSKGSLSSVNGIIAVLILDSQNSALSIQFSTKDTLAARWQVFCVIVGKGFGLITIGVVFNQV